MILSEKFFNPRQYYLVVGFLVIYLFYTRGKSKSELAAGCSKHCFEVVDKTDEVSSKHVFEVADETDEVSSKHCFEVVDKTDEVSNISTARRR